MEKKDILVVTVCLALLFVWFFTNSSRVPPPGEKQDNVEFDESTSARQESADSVKAKFETPTDTSDPVSHEQVVDESVSAEYKSYAGLPPALPATLTDDGVCDIKIDPEKGGVLQITVHGYKNKEGADTMRIGTEDFPLFNTQTSKDSWTFSQAKVELFDQKRLVISRAILGSPLILQQSWGLSPDVPYSLDYSFTLKNTGNDAIKLEDIKVNSGIMQPLDDTKSFMGASGIDQRVHILHSGSSSPKAVTADKISDYSDRDRSKAKAWRINWLTVENKYFVSMISSDTPFFGCNLLTKDKEPASPSIKKPAKYLAGYVYLPKATLTAGESRTWQFDCFTGPKKYDVLKSLGNNQESILEFDLFLLFHFKWMKGISLGILWCLNKLESVFHNYGVAIIIITLLIRIIFWPITHQTTLWSKKMQKIQPLAQEIREKYKNSPQKMQQKTMELYREHKINPVAGCLPMFLQIPVFFALFNVLRSAIELRQARFLWAKDLSQQDSIFTMPVFDIPFNPLAIIMGLTMIWQQKIVPTSADPVQQKVMMFMTGFFVLILYSMPSGLTLYWSINQIVSIFQHKITGKIEVNLKEA